MNDPAPLVSVCIPVFNCEQYLGFAIESVLQQTLPDFELVVIDNHSTDATLPIARSYGDPRVRVVENEENLGAEANWNKALAAARGRFIKILCADDLLYPSCLERQAGVLSEPENASVALVNCRRDVIDGNGRVLMQRGLSNFHGRMAGLELIRKSIRAGTNLVGEPAAVMLRRDLLDGSRRFDGANPYVIDFDFWCRLLLDRDVYVIGDALAAFRVSSGSWSVEVGRKQGRDFCRFINKIAAQPAYRLTPLDKGLGMSRAVINGFLRQIFYRVALRRR